MSGSKSSGKNIKSRYISIGSNISPRKNIQKALRLLQAKYKIKRVSSVYETEPVGDSGPAPFWNLAVEIESGPGKKRLLENLHEIEKRLGRTRNPANPCSARTIDLDLLPKAGYQGQPFVMIPLSEIAAFEKDTSSGKTFTEIAVQLSGKTKYRKVFLKKADALLKI